MLEGSILYFRTRIQLTGMKLRYNLEPPMKAISFGRLNIGTLNANVIRNMNTLP